MTYQPEVSGAKGDDLITQQREKYLVSLNVRPLLCKENVRYFTIHEYLRTYSAPQVQTALLTKYYKL